MSRTDPVDNPWILVMLSVLYVTVVTAVLVPVLLVAAAVGFTAGLVGSLVVGGAALWGAVDRPEPRNQPADDGVAADPVARLAGREPAWPAYLDGQARSDVLGARDAVRHRWTRGREGVQQVFDRYDDLDVPARVLLGPLMTVPGVAMVTVMAGGAVGIAAGAGTLAAAGGAAWAVRGAAVGAARALEDTRVRRGRLGASCRNPGCLSHSTTPIVECRACGRYHLDVRPGAYGVLRRRCACGEVMPATVTAAAAAGLTLRCPWCRSVLGDGTMQDRDVRLTVFGAPGSGTTSVIGAALADLGAGVDAMEVRQIDGRTAADHTTASVRSVRLAWRGRTTSLHLIDTPGRLLDEPVARARWHHLDAAHGFVVVVDVSTPHPELAYHALVGELADRRVPLRSRSLAVLLHKRDVLDDLRPGRGPRPDSTGIAAFLAARGHHNLVAAAHRDFGAVRYFSTAIDGPAARSPAAAVVWSARHAGVAFPPEATW